MEVLIDCYFDNLFAEMERDSLASRHKRRQLVKFFSSVINNCAEAEGLDRGNVCERIVNAALRYHNITMLDNGSVCLLGKFHNILYVAAKLCYDWNMTNNEIVCRIFNDMYHCEKTFERLFTGAIFGTRVTHFLSGWKSDFEDRDEHIKALVYFLDHAIAGRLEYPYPRNDSTRRLIDVPMESYGRSLPLTVAIQHGSPDILLLMLRYGATADHEDPGSPTPIEILLSRLNDHEGQYPQNLMVCLRVLSRTLLSVRVKTPNHLADQSGIESVPILEQFPKLAEANLLPDERCGHCPPELKQLCRCKIRECLYRNWALPHGIRTLHIPESLRSYLDLLSD